MINSIEEELQAMQELHHEDLLKLASMRQNATLRIGTNSQAPASPSSSNMSPGRTIGPRAANDPQERPTIFEIAKHPWVRSGICTHSEIKREFTERKQRLVKILEERRMKYEQ